MRSLAALLSFAALTLAAAPAGAVVIGGEVFGAFNTHVMGDWNDQIDEANDSGANIDNITTGFGGGIGARIWPGPNVMIAAGWEPLFASTDGSGTELDLTGHGVTGTLAYMFPAGDNARYGIGGGGGMYILSGTLKDSGSPDVDLGGSTFGFHVLGLAEWTVSPGFGITAGAGYRVANIGDTEADGQSADPEFETDFSGFTGRVGVTFYLPNSN